jgi:hypothetical protein
MKFLSRLIARYRRKAQRKVDSDRARKGHATRIHNQFLRDPVIREFGLTVPQKTSQPST